jgi:uncharacterized protein
MSRYEPSIDLSAISAIDMHVHVEQDAHGNVSMDDTLLEAAGAYFANGTVSLPTVESLAERYRAARMVAVVFAVDASTQTGLPPLSSVDIAEECSHHADVLIPFGSVDPRRGAAAVDQARRLVEDHGVRGFKFHPSVQAFAPHEEQYDPLWSTIAELGVPALFHTGQTGIGAGLPGGHGIKLRFSDPMLLDDVAADHPGLDVILAHPSVPWQAEAISMATHKANVYIDLSGWSPTYFPEELTRAVKGRLRHKVMFGSDFPMIEPERWMTDFATLGVKEELLPSIMKGTAARVLRL